MTTEPVQPIEGQALTDAERAAFEKIEYTGETQGLAWRVAQVKADAYQQGRADLAAAWDEGYNAGYEEANPYRARGADSPPR